MLTKNRFSAIKRAFLGGCIGLHDFYLGRNFRGTIKAVALGIFIAGFVTKAKLPSPILAIIALSNLVSGIKLLSMGQRDFDFKYNPHLFVKMNDGFPNTNIAIADEILKLNELFEKGLITFEEFEKRKNKLLN